MIKEEIASYEIQAHQQYAPSKKASQFLDPRAIEVQNEVMRSITVQKMKSDHLNEFKRKAK